MKFKSDPTKETETQRKERISLSGTTNTRVVPDKTKYNRKEKYKERFESFLNSIKNDKNSKLIETISTGWVLIESVDSISLPVAADIVDGLVVRKEIPNTSSIRSSFNNYKVLQGIREVQMADFETTKPNDLFYAKNDFDRVKQLSEQIKENSEISPLIVVLDAEGLYVLEGGHRLAALHILGKKSFPALVVKDLD